MIIGERAPRLPHSGSVLTRSGAAVFGLALGAATGSAGSALPRLQGAESAFPLRGTVRPPSGRPAPPAPAAVGAAFHHRTPERKIADKAAQQTLCPTPRSTQPGPACQGTGAPPAGTRSRWLSTIAGIRPDMPESGFLASVTWRLLLNHDVRPPTSLYDGCGLSPPRRWTPLRPLPLPTAFRLRRTVRRTASRWSTTSPCLPMPSRHRMAPLPPMSSAQQPTRTRGRTPRRSRVGPLVATGARRTALDPDRTDHPGRPTPGTDHRTPIRTTVLPVDTSKSTAPLRRVRGSRPSPGCSRRDWPSSHC